MNKIIPFPQPDEQILDPKEFTRRKFRWLDQVASDSCLPGASCRVAVILANRYLNASSAEAWPAIDTLARAVSVSENTIRYALRSLEARGHLAITATRGGKGRTNRYIPVIDGKPFRFLNPSDLKRQTLQNPSAKPFSFLKGNPYEGNPMKDSGDGLEPSPGMSPMIDSGRSRFESASPGILENGIRKRFLAVEDFIEWPGVGWCTILDAYPEDACMRVLVDSTGRMEIIPVGPDIVFVDQ